MNNELKTSDKESGRTIQFVIKAASQISSNNESLEKHSLKQLEEKKVEKTLHFKFNEKKHFKGLHF